MRKDFITDMMPDRIKSVSALLKQVLSEIVFREIKDPRVGSFITITDVRVSRDLRSARVFVSTIDDTKDINLAVQGLNNAGNFIRRRVQQEITMRRTPALTFMVDESIKKGVEMCNLIDSLREEDVKHEPTDEEISAEETSEE